MDFNKTWTSWEIGRDRTHKVLAQVQIKGWSQEL